MSRRRRRGTEDLSLSFLDAICCGFGAIILLLVLTKIGEPGALEKAVEDLRGLVAKLELELHEIRGETIVRNRELLTKEEQLSEERALIARLRGDLERIRGEYAATNQLSQVSGIIEGRLVAAQQELTEEMKRLQAQQPPKRDKEPTVGGIPVDSEYVIFIIDTSGSMHSYSWSLAIEKMRQTLDIYPKVLGIQVMNDMGQYMFSTYQGKWIPDTPARRKAIIDRLRGWQAFSNSSPIEGIEAAIRTFAKGDKKISLYVFGDEFTGASIDEVVTEVDRLNRPNQKGERPVRIHGIGFPVMFSREDFPEQTGVRFATLMRILCHRNGGTFVALNHVTP